MTRVLLTIGRLDRGGAEMRLLQLLQEAGRRNAGIEVLVFIVSGQAGGLDEAYRAAGARLIHGAPGLRGLWRLYCVCRSERPDIVHANVLLASGFHLFAAWLAGVRVRIAHIRNTGYDRDDLLFRMRNVCFRLVLNIFSTRVVGVCDGVQAFSGARRDRWQTIYNGLDPARASFQDTVRGHDSLFDVVFLGRLHAQKNPVRAVEIVAAVGFSADMHCRLKIYGRPAEPLNSAVTERIRTLGLEDRVELCGETDEPIAALCAADVLLLTSTREGLPGVVLEALACGTPVVASALPGVVEIARHCEGVTAIDLAQDDDVWAAALIAAARSDRAAIAASFRASPFTFERHYESMMSLWDRARRKRDVGTIS